MKRFALIAALMVAIMMCASCEEDTRPGLDNWEDESGERCKVALPVYGLKK